MRKGKKIVGVACVLLLVLLAAVLVACNDHAPLESKQEQNTTIFVFANGKNEEFMATYGSQLTVPSYTNNGYYLKGIYDKTDGGTKYFDSSGNSLGVWMSTNPTQFYAQWEDYSTLAPVEFATLYEDDAESYSKKTTLQWRFRGEMLNAIMGNLDKQLKLTLSFRVKEGTGLFNTNGHTTYISVRDKQGDDGDVFGETYTATSYTSDYTSYTKSWVVDARCARNGGICVQLNRGNDFNVTYIRDVKLVVEFA